MNKRYSIVRVDGSCQLSDINIGNINVCKISKSCQNCLFGDTKEQLIKKVEQELTRQVFQNNFRLKDIATKIVEFLGVE